VKATPEVAQALSNLRGNPDFQTVLKWVRDAESKEQEKCVDSDGLVLYRAQGSAKTLRAFTETFDGAPDLLKKFKQQQQQQPVQRMNTQ
jgi:hypothetical protein